MNIDGEIKDRGRIKWTAMMLPEHLTELRNWHTEDDRTVRPELTEWDLAAIQEEIEIAYRRKCETLIKTWRNNHIFEYQGIIETIDLHNKLILLADPFGDLQISIEQIISVQSIN
ncbi:YolD-like family protein [Sporosarcina sp. ACRSL]|uniref:YolD-like family protein n=1 Tax=Sporosarcina sp. ACRSL TaxID=2918215 RepID=UPI001EF700E8|nr:YolD-like family protein [Sporosarcina sp. ACRSL]MCG7344778.1 YolD-like family protein [Sporosarcina sp. ACRSL]